MNCLNFIGNIGNDAEVRHTPTGKSITSFSVAMNSGWGDNQHTTWVRCTMWGDRGEKVAPYLLKGQKVAITGEASMREWEGGGKSGVSFECKVDNVTLCGEKKMADPGQQYNKGTEQAKAAMAPDFDDQEIPF